MTRLEIINETVEYYMNHPRSIGIHSYCLYKNEEGNKCAVGRCLTDQALEIAVKYNGVSVTTLLDYLHSHGLVTYTDVFKPEYIPDDVNDEEITHISFWESLQCIHDFRLNWVEDSPGANKRTLTAEGEKSVQRLKDRCR